MHKTYSWAVRRDHISAGDVVETKEKLASQLV
jgi:hypothetical protein